MSDRNVMGRSIAIVMLSVCCLAAPLHAVKIADITRIGGQRSNVLTGLGLVYGLPGTGDGGDFLPAIRPLASMLGKFADPATVGELAKVQNVALVSLTATVPSHGVRDGDRIDVYVTSLGAARSLRGGRLFVTPMQGPLPDSGIFALAEGPLVIEDPSTPTVAVIKGGAVMEADLPAHYLDDGRFTLILEDPSASWGTASTIAQVINDAESIAGETIAVAVDPKNVVVTIPPAERQRPDSFISRVQRLPLPIISTEARVQINQRTGTMVVTGDVEISPAVISHKGLTITTAPPRAAPTREEATRPDGARLQDLVSALEQLKVPAEDRITIVKELHKTGKLHAKLVVE